ncbi:MAG: CRTAC1 family protein [Planctomycetes bacterium]|nr:CRTAC1 family protein [Planctomycetota bacterium]
MRTAVIAAIALTTCIAVGLAQDEKPARSFVDVSETALPADATGGRVYLHDLDDDGYPDLILQNNEAAGPGNNGGVAIIMFNREAEDGGRKFVEEPGLVPEHNAGEFAKDARLTSVFTVVGDFNNDGVADLFRPCYQEAADHEKFPDTGERAGVWLGKKSGSKVKYKLSDTFAATERATTCAVAQLDYDRDGNLDLFLGNWYVAYGKLMDAQVDRLFKGDGKGGFTDVTEEAKLLTKSEPAQPDSSRPTYGAAACDYNGDGWPDIAVASYGRQWNRLWKNNGDGTFTDVAPELGVDGDEIRHGKYPDWVKRDTEEPWRANGNTFSLAPADFDNDGDIDLFDVNIRHGWAGDSSDYTALLINGGKEKDFKFTRLTEPFIRKHADPDNWNQGDLMALWGDFDHDGLQDILLASAAYPDDQRLRLFRQTPEHSFEDVTVKFKLDIEECGHVAIGDIDLDGDLDIVGIGNQSRFNKRKHHEIHVWRNDIAQGNWLEITLQGGKGCNGFAYGAKVWVTAGETRMLREVISSAGHQGVAPPRTLHFGLGKAEKVSIKVEWPDKKLTTQEFKDIATNQRYTLKQGGKPK